MLYIVSGARSRCSILIVSGARSSCFILSRIMENVLDIVSGAKSSCCILSQDQGGGAVYCLWS